MGKNSASISASGIINRSPWSVLVQARPELEKQFSYPQKRQAKAYCDELKAAGRKARVVQQEVSFQLRVRRAGLKPQFITFSARLEAEQAQLKIVAELSVSIVRDYATAARTTLRELMERYRDEVTPGHKGGTIEAQRLDRIMRMEAFVDKRLAALTTEDLQDFICDRLTEVKPATVDRGLDVLSQTLNYADDVWKIAPVESPFKGLRRPKYFNERDRRLAAGEEQRLLVAARADVNQYLEPAIILALETAMRRGELLTLTAQDIDFDRREALVRDSKNGRARRVPLTRAAMDVLQALIREGKPRLLDLTANALKLGFFNRALKRAGINDLHFHDLRHESISRLAESGQFVLIELQAISGHRDLRMLQRYAHLCSGGLARKMDHALESNERSYVHRGRRRKVLSVSDDQPVSTAAAKLIVTPDASPELIAAPRSATNIIAFPTARLRRMSGVNALGGPRQEIG